MLLPCLTKLNKDSRFGFTLIEVLVSVGILVVLTAMGVASYNNFNEKRVVRNAADKIRSNLRLAQRKALAGEKNCDSCGGAVCNVALVGWYADFSSSPPQIYGECGTTKFGYKDIDLSSSVDLNTDIPDNKILFKSLRGGTDLADEATITITGFVDKTETVYITTGGEIK